MWIADGAFLLIDVESPNNRRFPSDSCDHPRGMRQRRRDAERVCNTEKITGWGIYIKIHILWRTHAHTHAGLDVIHALVMSKRWAGASACSGTPCAAGSYGPAGEK